MAVTAWAAPRAQLSSFRGTFPACGVPKEAGLVSSQEGLYPKASRSFLGLM